MSIRSILKRLAVLLPLLAAGGAAPVTGCQGDRASGPCCRVCREGKPCGDSCIAKTETCHKGGGCACGG
jgi:hypothetical protein